MITGQRRSVAGTLMALQAAAKFRKSISKQGALSETSSQHEGKRPVKILIENTYRLEPDQSDTVVVFESRIKRVVKNTLEEELGQFKYESERASRMCTSLADQIRERVKDLDIPRYKFVCSVFIAENKEQGVQSVSRCLWNHSTDSYVTVNYSNTSLYATAMVHGVYFE